VDGARYQDEVYRAVLDHLKIKKHSNANFLFWHKYLAKTGGKYSKKNRNTIALIYVTGDIHRGVGGGEFRPSVGSDSLCAAIRAATKDKRVKAIVLRVDSRGGSYTASDTIYHEIQVAKNAGKKVVASMGNVAASGGYYISMAADQIVAQPATLTGSIGVIFGKLATRELWNKIGMTHDTARVVPPEDGNGIYNDFYSPLHTYEKDEDIKKREEVLDYIYEDFTKKVAFSRKLGRDQVEAVAQGRVWTGRQALERGLVDILGGLEDAIQTAKTLAEIPASTTPFVQIFPKQSIKTFLLPPKNRDQADKYGQTSAGLDLNKFADNVSLLSDVACAVSEGLHMYLPLINGNGASQPLADPFVNFVNKLA